MQLLSSLLDRPGYDEENLARLKLLLGLVALLALGVEAKRAHEGDPVSTRWKKRVGAVFAVLGVIAFFQFFQVGYREFYHRWEFFHDYLGMRYHRELGYGRFYECVAVAESELPGGLQEVKTRKLRDLRANLIVATDDALEHPERCKASFEPGRWEQFRSDVEVFRRAMWGNYWRDAQKDHGYVSPPARTLLGEALIPAGPTTVARLQALSALDPLLIALMFGLVAWAFGWRVLCVTVAFWGIQDLSPFYWNGGAFLRQDWLFCLVASVCLARRRLLPASGAMLALSMSLRGFPVFFFLGPVALLCAAAVRWRPLARRIAPFFVSAFLATTLVSGAAVVRYGPKDFPDWAHHMAVGPFTPLSNLVGWRTTVAYSHEHRMQVVKDPRMQDPYSAWQTGRYQTLHGRPWLYQGARLLAAAAVALASVRARRLWIAIALGSVAVFFGYELPCYYAIHLLALGLLTRARPGLEAPLLLAATLTQVAHRQFGWFDQRYVAMSVVATALCAAALGAFVRAPAGGSRFIRLRGLYERTGSPPQGGAGGPA